MPNKQEQKIDLDILRESYGRVSYTQTTHEYEIQSCSRRTAGIKWLNVILTAVTFGGVIGIIVFDEQVFKIVSAILSTISLGVATYQLSFNPEEDKVNHKIATKELWYIREKYKNLIADVMKGILTEEQIRKQRDALLEELKLVYKFAPNTSNTAYQKAQKALQEEEEQTFTQEELDNLLPESLRMTNSTEQE